MLRERMESKTSQFVFAYRDGKPYLGTSINHLHRDACAPKIEGKRRALFPADFVMHSLRHTMLTRHCEIEGARQRYIFRITHARSSRTSH